MATVEKDKILRYQAEIKESQAVLAEITSGDLEEAVHNPMKIRAMKYSLIVLVEAICNLGRHILAKKVHVAVEEYMETILKMQEKGFLSDEIADKLIPLMKLRHQLIHGYWKTDDRRLLLETKDSLETIDRFVSEIHSLVSKNQAC